MDYFRLIWQSAHLYRVEDDWSLSLIAPSPEALQLGIEAPEKVCPDASLLKKIQTVIKRGIPATPSENGPDECVELSTNRNLAP